MLTIKLLQNLKLQQKNNSFSLPTFFSLQKTLYNKRCQQFQVTQVVILSKAKININFFKMKLCNLNSAWKIKSNKNTINLKCFSSLSEIQHQEKAGRNLLVRNRAPAVHSFGFSWIRYRISGEIYRLRVLHPLNSI